MLGAPSVVAADGVTVSVHPDRCELRAERALEAFATARFSRPRAGVAWSAASWPNDIEFVGCAFTQFALPVTAGGDLDFDFRPAPGLRSPRAVSPLIARGGDRVVLLAPRDTFHEQLIAVSDDRLVWGWHGDLDDVSAGFTSTLGIYHADTVDSALDAWRADLGIAAARISRSDNPLSTHLSYWTDNGAAYWYRTERGRTIGESVSDTVERLRSDEVPVRSIELDSWFYPHTTSRPIAEIGYPDEVPPTGMATWSTRVDAFPVSDGDPIERFAERLGRPPLTLHTRHIAPTSPYVDDPERWWVDDHAAQPIDPAFFRRWFDDAVRWGATVIEQDWMLMYWFGVRQLRAAPGRAAAWQRALDTHAGDTGVDLIWCMATPADLMLAAALEHVIAVRTCDDYRFTDDPAFLWTWFLIVNRLSNALGLVAFKDCFFSQAEVADGGDAIDGDPHAELEALLAALSNGPVGIGDRIGRTDRDIVMRTCDDDGRIRRLDRGVAAIDDGLFGAPARGERLMWATTTATTSLGVWTYVVAINTATHRRVIADAFELERAVTVFDWRRGTGSRVVRLDADLAPRDWALFVLSPPGAPVASAVGDPTKYVVVESAR